MRKMAGGLGALVVAMALSTVANGQMAAGGPVPEAIGAAKRIFVANAGADSGLFPHPFSGEPRRAYDEFYAGLKATGAWELVSDPSAADLVLELRLTAPYGPSDPDKQKGASDPLPMFRLVVFDGKSHYVVWALTETVGGANLQKSHDKNFDDALAGLERDFVALSGKAPAVH